MTLEQDRMDNPYGMDPDCTNCAALSETRQSIVHGYGDVSADFMFVAEAPTAAADEAGHPLASTECEYSLRSLLAKAGFLGNRTDSDNQPVIDNAFVTYLTRCRHPDRSPTAEEIANCDPFLNAELRTINPDILIPLGKRALSVIARDFSTMNPDELAISEVHGNELRGRGFEILPLIEPATMTKQEFDEAVKAIARTLGRDYRQTKGRRKR